GASPIGCPAFPYTRQASGPSSAGNITEDWLEGWPLLHQQSAMIFTPVPYQADPADYQLDAGRAAAAASAAAAAVHGWAASTPGKISHRLRHTWRQSDFFGMRRRVWGSTLGRGGLLLLIAGSGLLTAAALHHFCKERLEGSSLTRLLCCRGSGAAAALPGIAHLVASNGSASGGGKIGHGAAAAAALRLRTGQKSNELLMECRKPAHACLTPIDLTRRAPSCSWSAEPAHACLPIDLTREHRAAMRCRNPPTPVSEHSQYCRSKTAQLQFEASPLPPGASRRGGIRSLTFVNGLGLSKPLIYVVRIEAADSCGGGNINEW
uniref:Fibronectin type-III domain-containing protein n=1 Tax=Macrostomum lignano TaxID=282301 RepID=A0A1I8F8A1_9PLAT